MIIKKIKWLVSHLWLGPAILVCIGYLRCWSVYYNSDTALIGLMADNVLTLGERPLYVWGVGYMGILLEVYGTALVFKVFGMSPITLNCVSVGVFLLFVVVYRLVLTQMLGESIGSIGAVLLGCLGPTIYGYWLRPIPNYVEVVFFGTCATWLYTDIIKGNKVSPGWWALFGFVLGFGLYTNQQSLYFYGALGLHAYLVLWQKSEEIKVHKHHLLSVLYKVLYAVLVLGAVSYITAVENLGPIKWQAYSTMKLVVGALVVISLVRWLYALRTQLIHMLVNHKVGVIAACLGWTLGYGPELYGRYILKIQTTSRTGLGVSYEQFVQNLAWILQAYGKYFGVNSGAEPIPESHAITPIGSALPQWVLVASAGILIVFLASGIIKMGQYIWTKKMTEVSPLYLLPFVVIPIVAFAKITMGYPNSRYAAAAVPGVLALIILGALSLWQNGVHRINKQHGLGRKNLTVAIAMVFAIWPIATAIIETSAKLNQHTNDHPHYSIIQKLNKLEIKTAEADYWTAHSAEFLSGAKIRIRPKTSNYNPDRYDSAAKYYSVDEL